MEGCSKRVIQWDEATLAEHDKERGTRQKIDEPPTPYQYGSDRSDSGESDGEECESAWSRQMSGDLVTTAAAADFCCDDHEKLVVDNRVDARASLDWSTLNAKLSYERHLQEGGEDGTRPLNLPHTVFRNSSAVSHAENPDDGSITSSMFKEKRNAHYNEFKVIQAMRKQRAGNDDNDSDDDDDGY